MSQTPNIPPQQEALNQLRDQLPFGPMTKEDHDFFEEQQAEIDAERSSVGLRMATEIAPVKRFGLIDGVVVPSDVIEKMQADGQPVVAPSTAGRRT